MSAKDARARVWSLYQRPGTPLQFEEALDAYAAALLKEHARALAGRIREAAFAEDGPGTKWDWWDAATIPGACADLIDPPES